MDKKFKGEEMKKAENVVWGNWDEYLAAQALVNATIGFAAKGVELNKGERNDAGAAVWQRI